MTVECFTPSKEDIEQAPARLHFYKMWRTFISKDDLLPDQSEMCIIDFTDCFTPEERQAHKNWFLLTPTFPRFNFMSGGGHYPEHKDITVEFTSLMNFGETVHAQDLARKIIAHSKGTPPMINPESGIIKGNPKDFTPVPTLSVLPAAQIKPSYHVKVVNTINGQWVRNKKVIDD